MTVWLKVSKWFKPLPLIHYAAVIFMVGQSMGISRGKNDLRYPRILFYTDLNYSLQLASSYDRYSCRHINRPLLIIHSATIDFELTLTEYVHYEPTQKVILDATFHRNITLVSGYSYEINCNHKMGGFRGETNIWFHFNGMPVTLPNTTATLASVYAVEVDINNWKLVLQEFREIDSGVYTCRGPTSSVSLDIKPGIRIQPHCTGN